MIPTTLVYANQSGILHSGECLIYLQTSLISIFGMGIISVYIGPMLKLPVKMLLQLNFTH